MLYYIQEDTYNIKMLNQFYNLSCYEEFEIQCTLMGISKIDILKEIGHKISRYYVFVSNDGVFNWFDLKGNHIKYPNDLVGVVEYLSGMCIPNNISKCIIPDNIKHIANGAFFNCHSLTTVYIPSTITYIGYYAFETCDALKEVIFKGKSLEDVKQMDNYIFWTNDESIIKCEIN
jgi:hypothetical protein